MNCRCLACEIIHADFIQQFGRWPNKTHEESLKIKADRESNLASWEVAS